MIEDLKNKGFKEEKAAREILIRVYPDKVKLEKCETSSVFELRGILEQLLRNL